MSEASRNALGHALFDYMIGRADDALGVEDANVAAFQRFELVPRLFGGEPPDLRASLAGRPLAAPLVIGAFAGDRVFHPEGLLPVARSTQRMGLAMVVSEETVTPLDEITAANPETWLQLRAAGSVDRVTRIIKGAANAGAVGIVLTLMAPSHPRPGQRPGGFDIGAELRRRGWQTIGTMLDGSNAIGVAPLPALPIWGAEDLRDAVQAAYDARLPLIVKGVLHPGDAMPVMQAGAAGLAVSNIGLRQSDRWAPALDQLPRVRAAVPQAQILIDGGIRHPADILIARLLGADLAVTTRPVISALTGGGEAAVDAFLRRMIDGLYALTLWMGDGEVQAR
ncbi:alpha-hydroxy acid oxidase [Falsirhodobacter halotolerans]|uniref:alpha-hydroxy acid oxidase n=1 Tax=Falsirhodobacter halotolerans TaxID=1146892 RepID=UPI001FD16F1C|nr:alpha-hydroxy acid oxidase [Falsirhodobacter halotolerans]MCJ8139096.1 alpha-hydroxy-acid oxidizing protein [Falsirhodobacter halotolerans]